MEKKVRPPFGRMALQIMPTIEAKRPPQPSWPGTYQCSSPSLGRSLHILAHLGLCSAQKRVVILLRFLSFWIWRKKMGEKKNTFSKKLLYCRRRPFISKSCISIYKDNRSLFHQKVSHRKKTLYCRFQHIELIETYLHIRQRKHCVT